MAASAFSEDFASLSAWTASGITLSAGEVRATTGGTPGLLYRAYGGTQGDMMAVVARIVPDKSDTSGRWVLVGMTSDPTGPFGAGYGMGVNYTAGTGFRVGLVESNAPYGASQTVILADANVVDDQPYWVVLVIDSQSSVRVAVGAVYDNMGVYKGGGVIDANTDTWASMHRSIVAANSAVSKVSRLAVDPNPFGSPTTILNRVVDTQGMYAYGNSTNKRMGIYAPGAGSSKGALVVQLHGAGTWSADEAYGGTGNSFVRTNAPNAWVENLNRAGFPVITPSEYSTAANSTNSFASPDAYTLTVDQINWALGKLGAGTKVILVGQSMGALMALRLVTGGDIDNIVAVCLYDPLTSLSAAYTDPNNGTFVSPMNAAWGGSIGSLATYDAHALLAANSAAFRGISWYISYCTDDLVVYPSRYGSVFAGLLQNAGIPYTLRSRPYGGHVSLTKLIPRSDAAEFAGMASLATAGDLSTAVDSIASAISGMQVDVTSIDNQLGNVDSAINDVYNQTTAASMRTAVGLASANLDTQLATVTTQTSAATIRTAVGLTSANLNTQLSGIATSATDSASSAAAVQAKLPAAGRNMAGAGTTATNLDQITVEGASAPLANKPVSDEFTVTLSSRLTPTLTAARRIYAQSTEKLMIGVNFAALLHKGDCLASITTVTEKDGKTITLTPIGVCGQMAKFWVEDAEYGESYQIETKVLSDFGNALEGDFLLYVAT